MLTKAPWGSKKEGYHTIKSLDISSQASAVGSILAESYTCVLGRVLGLVRCEKETQHNWPKVNKDPEDLSYIRDLSHLFTVLLLIREDSHTLSLWVCISAWLLTYTNYFSACSPIGCANINFVPVFKIFTSLKHSCFQRRGRAWEFHPLPLVPVGLVVRIPGFHPGYRGSIPGQKTKISHQDCSLLFLQDQSDACSLNSKSLIPRKCFLLDYCFLGLYRLTRFMAGRGRAQRRNRSLLKMRSLKHTIITQTLFPSKMGVKPVYNLKAPSIWKKEVLPSLHSP